MRCEPLFKIPEELLPEVGGKARGLYLLNQAGLPVSDGFILYDVQTEEDLQKERMALTFPAQDSMRLF